MSWFDDWSGSDLLGGLGALGTLNPSFLLGNIGAIGGLGSLGIQGYNTWLNKKNQDNQEDLLAYQQNLQNFSWLREDNAVQRRVADLKAAGLSPVLAAGSAASSGPIVSTSAPQHAPSPLDPAGTVLSLLKMTNDIATSVEQRKLLHAQASKASIDSALTAHDLGIYEATGTASNAGSMVKDIRDILGMVGSSPIVDAIKSQVSDKVSQIKKVESVTTPQGDKNPYQKPSWHDDSSDWDRMKKDLQTIFK